MSLGLIAALIAAVGNMILGWGVYDESQSGLAYSLSLLGSISDGGLLESELLGIVGMSTELLCLLAVYRLMKGSAPKLAHAYRAGIIGCTIFGVCDYHVSFVAVFLSYKNVLALAGTEQALSFITRYALYFVVSSVASLLILLIVLTMVQIAVFVRGRTPYPRWCWVFSNLLGAYVAYVACELIGNFSLTNAIGTAWFHVGTAYMYTGLQAAMPGKV